MMQLEFYILWGAETHALLWEMQLSTPYTLSSNEKLPHLWIQQPSVSQTCVHATIFWSAIFSTRNTFINKLLCSNSTLVPNSQWMGPRLISSIHSLILITCSNQNWAVENPGNETMVMNGMACMSCYILELKVLKYTKHIITIIMLVNKTKHMYRTPLGNDFEYTRCSIVCTDSAT